MNASTLIVLLIADILKEKEDAAEAVRLFFRMKRNWPEPRSVRRRSISRECTVKTARTVWSGRSTA